MRTLLLVLVTVAACADRSTLVDRGPADPWHTVGIGTMFETKTVTRMVQPFVHESESTTRQTILAKTAEQVSIKLEQTNASGDVSAQDITIPVRHAAHEPCTGTLVTTTVDDTCTVEAGTFDCTRTMLEVRDGDVVRSSETWTAKNIPVPIRSVVTNDRMTTTTELVRVARR